MSTGGFVKRRRGILEHFESGEIGWLDLAVHDYLSLKANLLMDATCSIPPGVCFSSSVALHAINHKGADERALRRSLEHLERIGWIKRWIPKGKRGNYPILLCRASVHDLSAVEYRVNGLETTDWRHPVLELAAVCPQSVRRMSGHREKREESREASSLPGSSSLWKEIGIQPDKLPKPFLKLCEDLYATKNGQPLVEFMGLCMDIWQGQGKRIPRPFARAAAAIREREKAQSVRNDKPCLPELEEMPWKK